MWSEHPVRCIKPFILKPYNKDEVQANIARFVSQLKNEN